jgi:hypothetical protein
MQFHGSVGKVIKPIDLQQNNVISKYLQVAGMLFLL